MAFESPLQWGDEQEEGKLYRKGNVNHRLVQFTFGKVSRTELQQATLLIVGIRGSRFSCEYTEDILDQTSCPPLSVNCL